MFYRYITFIIIICVHSAVYAVTDTVISLKEIEVYGDRFSAFSVGTKTQSLDSIDRAVYRASGINRLMSLRGGMFIKDYGPGMLATPSLRGGSASQTALFWNGFNIQSPMHGQNDYSLFPVFFSDQINIQYGCGGSIWGSGAIGGVVNLNNHIDFDGKVYVESEVQAGSIQNYSQMLHLRASGKKLAGSLRVFNQNANNNFDYKNPHIENSPVYKREHSEIKQQGILSEMYYQNHKNNSAVIRLWFQKNDRNIPPTLFQTHSGATQLDEAVRMTANWNRLFKHGMLSVKTAYFDETIFYRDSVGVESYSNSDSWIQELDYNFLDYKNHSLNFGLSNSIVSATSGHYPSDLSIQRIAAFSSWKWSNRPGSLSMFISARQEWQDNMDIPFTPAAGIEYQVFTDVFVKANAGRNFRIPSLNDLYWEPGGNPDLLPESGWNQDITIQYGKDNKAKPTNNLNFEIRELSVTGFHRKIDNWIIWLPKSGIWTPQNVMKVRSAGLESSSILRMKAGNAVFQLKMLYDYMSSKNEVQKSPNDESVGKQLIYVPKHNAGAVLTAMYGAFSVYYEHNYTGKRFISSDNLHWIEPFNVGNAGVNYRFKLYDTFLTARFDVQNIWNENYMIVSNNPMPMRYFQFGLNIKWDKTVW